jgi:hypothetical protein
VLSRRADGIYELAFWLTDPDEEAPQNPAADATGTAEIPEYVMVEETV